MKIYALIHGVCGIAEGYSETECYFHKDKASAVKDQSQWLSVYTEAPHDEVIISADRDEFLIVRNDDDSRSKPYMGYRPRRRQRHRRMVLLESNGQRPYV